MDSQLHSISMWQHHLPVAQYPILLVIFLQVWLVLALVVVLDMALIVVVVVIDVLVEYTGKKRLDMNLKSLP